MPNNPNDYTDRANYVGKTAAELGHTQDLESSGAFANTIIGVGDKYMIDIYGNMITHKAEDTPLLSILANLGTVSEAPPYIVWNDEYQGNMWWDTAIDNLRLRDNKSVFGDSTTIMPMSGYGATYATNTMPIAITESGYKGGQLRPLSATTLTSSNNILKGDLERATFGPCWSGAKDGAGDAQNSATGMLFSPVNGNKNRVLMGFMQDDNNTVGTMYTVYNRLHQLFTNLGYTYDYAAGAATAGYMKDIKRFSFAEGSSLAPVFMALDEVHSATGASGAAMSSYHEVLVQISQFGIFTVDTKVASGTKTQAGTYMFFELNFDVSNTDITIATYNGSTAIDSVLVSAPIAEGRGNAAGYAEYFESGSTKPKYIGKMSRMVHIGRNMAAPLPVPEGDTFAEGGNFTQYRERLTNYSQIFATPKYGITGTHQASKFRFGDDFQQTRAMWLELYKGWKESAFLWGVKGETTATATGVGGNSTNKFMTGQPVRSLGGLMDYALFPITYMKKALGAVGYSGETKANSESLLNWLDEIGDSLTTFKYNGSKDLTFLVSKNFLRRLIPYTRLIQNSGDIMGGQVQLTKPSQLTFGLEIYSFVTAGGVTIKFIHEPSLDILPSFPVPYWVFGAASINPRDTIISIDTNNIKQVNCRPDRIYGNIQDIGQDAFMEGMRGESSFILRYPKNHAIIYAPTA